MANFDDFTKVLMAANENVKQMEEQTKIVTKEISRVQNDRYNTVKDFWTDVCIIVMDSKLYGMFVNLPIIIGNTSLRVRPNFGGNHITEIAVHTMDNDSSEGFLRWLFFYDTYEETMHRAKDDSRIAAFLQEMIDHWEEYEEDISIAFKEAATKAMAERVRKAEVNHMKKLDELNNL